MKICAIFIKTMPTKKIYLSGGGSEKDSRLLDYEFTSVLNKEKPVIYVPNAMEAQKYKGAFSWFTSVMSRYQINNVILCASLKVELSPTDIAGIYIGGGNSTKLLHEIKSKNFDQFIFNAVENNVPIYGGSAGAVILGKSIKTVPEARSFSNLQSHGLDLLGGFSVFPHFLPTQEIDHSICTDDLIAIPERSGVYYDGNCIKNFGSEMVMILKKSKFYWIEPFETMNLTTESIN